MSALIVIVLVFIFSLILTKRIVHPVTIFSLMWSVILGLYQINISRFNHISNSTYFIIASGVVSFAMGYIFFLVSIKDTRITIGNFRKSVNNEKLEEIRYGLLKFLCISTIIVLLPEAINSILILAGGGSFETIRTNFSNGYSVLDIGILSLYRNYIVKPFCYIVYPICAVDFILGKRQKWLLIFTIIISFLSALYEGGRIQFVYFALHFLLIARLARIQIKIPKVVKRVLVMLLALMVVIVLYITTSRGSKEPVIQSLLLYISGCVPLMDSHLSAVGFHPNYTYGVVAISGFLKPFFSILENFGFPYPSFLLNIQHVFEVEQTISIGTVFHMNAYVSLFYYFFYDGGFVGNIIGSFLYGGLSRLIYRRIGTMRGMVYYALIFQGLLFSMIRFQFTISHYCLSFILLYFLFKRENVNEIK